MSKDTLIKTEMCIENIGTAFPPDIRASGTRKNNLIVNNYYYD
jgi:hypothetical protein